MIITGPGALLADLDRNFADAFPQVAECEQSLSALSTLTGNYFTNPAYSAAWIGPTIDGSFSRCLFLVHPRSTADVELWLMLNLPPGCAVVVEETLDKDFQRVLSYLRQAAHRAGFLPPTPRSKSPRPLK